MKTIAFALALLSVFLALPLAADACSYGSGYSAFGYGGYASSYSYVPAYVPTYSYFQIVPPTQATIAVPQVMPQADAQTQVQQQTTTTTTTTTFAPPPQPAPVVGYSYAAPLSTIVQYQLPLYAPVQAYYSNYGFHGSSRGFNRRY